MVKQHRLLIATDIPFWRRSTGAEQRIASLVRYLATESIQIRTFYLGQSLDERDFESISELELDVEFQSSDQAPRHLINKVQWYAAATLHQLRRGADRSQTGDGRDEHPPAPPSLVDYRWPWAITAFGESVRQFKPTAILVEYIKLAYLLEALSPKQSNEIHCLIDTHDVLHQRFAQFRDYGFAHWIAIDRETEARELRRFDTILAIQPTEASLFREMVPECQTIVCGHSPAGRSAGFPLDDSPDRRLVIGYLGSGNASNFHAINQFLSHVWKPIQDTSEGTRMELVVAGGVCDWLDGTEACSEAKRNTRFLGRVEELKTFYDSVDVVINPVEFGTGLKIKNSEAISFGKPLLTTEQGWIGMPPELEPAVVVCLTPESMVERLLGLLNDRECLVILREAAAKLSHSGFSDEQVYSELKRSIFRGK